MSTAGYSGTPLVNKLGIKPGATLGLIGAPDGFDRTLGELPGGVTVRRRLQGRLDVIVAFYRGALGARATLAGAARRPAAGGRPVGRMAKARLRRGHGS